MKKVIISELLLVFLLALTIGVVLYRKDPREDISRESVEELVESLQKGELKKAGPLEIKRHFSLEGSDYEYILYYTAQESMDVREFLFVKGEKDVSDTAEKAMEERLASQMNAFDHYGEKQMELLNKAVIWQNGPYAFFLVAEDPDAWMKKINDLLEVSHGIQ